MGIVAGAFLGWKLFAQSKMPTVNDMKPTSKCPTSKLPTVSEVPNPHHME